MRSFFDLVTSATIFFVVLTLAPQAEAEASGKLWTCKMQNNSDGLWRFQEQGKDLKDLTIHDVRKSIERSFMLGEENFRIFENTKRALIAVRIKVGKHRDGESVYVEIITISKETGAMRQKQFAIDSVDVDSGTEGHCGSVD